MTYSTGASAHGFYEFFAGGGMARAGLGEGWRCLYANDIDEKKAASYEQNWGGDELQVADVSAVTTDDLPETAELAWSSFPCQDLSLAGSGSGLGGERSGTFWPFWRLMEALKEEERAPTIIVLENVCGALTSHRGRDFEAIGKAISDTGYRFGAVVMDAVHFVPQSRPRLFIVAIQGDIKLPDTVTLDRPDEHWHSRALIGAYGRLSKPYQDRWVWWSMPKPTARNTVLGDLIEEEPGGVKWHTRRETRYLLSLMSVVNRKKVTAAKKASHRMVGAIYRRTRPDGNGGRTQRAEIRFDNIAGCLRTPVGGSSRQTIMIVDGNKVRSRLLSPREASRLMGLSDDYELPEKYNDAYYLAGDGLVVPVVRHLAANVLEPVLTAANGSNKWEAA